MTFAASTLETSRRGPWSGDVVSIHELGTREIALWQRLTHLNSQFRSPFFSFEFARAVAESNPRARVCLLQNGGDLVGFFPFQFVANVPSAFGIAERIGGTLSDFCGIIIDAGLASGITTSDLLKCSNLQVFEMSHLDEGQANFGLKADGVSSGARIRLPDQGMAAYWAKVKTAHGSGYETLKNRERKLRRECPDVRFVFFCDDVPQFVKLVVAEKRMQYKRTGAADGFAEAWKLGCLDRIAKMSEGRCLPVVSGLFVNGDWVALHFGIRAGTVLHYWFPIYSQRFSNYSPGILLLASMLEISTEFGIREIDLGEGLAPYKQLFATETYPLYRDLWYLPTVRALAYKGFQSFKWRAASCARLVRNKAERNGRGHDNART